MTPPDEGSSPPGARGDRGAGSVLTAIGVIVLISVTMIGWWILAWTDAVRQAGHAADLAALAGAGAYAASRDPCGAARLTATANRGRLVGCWLSGTPQAFALTVRVVVTLHPQVRGGPREVGADAVAGSGMR